MRIRAMILAFLAGTALSSVVLAADTGRLSPAESAKQGDRVEGGAGLILAASRNNVEMVDRLLRGGADPKGANEYGATALYAAASENADPAITKKLWRRSRSQCRADVGRNAAHASGPHRQRRDGACVAGGRRRSQRAGKNGGQNALMWAAAERHPAVTELLVQHKADVNAIRKMEPPH
jgi:ankyrin repeat protein